MTSLTPLAFASLGLLAEGPMHPYEMFQTMIHRKDDRHVKVRPGTLYHQVGRLTELGLAEVVGTDRDGNRPERTTYAITDAGRSALRDGLRRMVAEPAEEYPEFHLALAEIENLPVPEAVDAVRVRVAALRDELAFYDQGLADMRAKGLAERFRLDVAYVRAMLTTQIEWLSATADRIASGDIPWDGPAVPDDITTNSKETTR
ncbi:PadR family transcriptional regulator [Curtobacterium sp. PhB130]|uniref:PadR family transcriptional regulator n=1 Tax=unclassified Curtobacterium TaxID=257496 RepID=UPI000FA1B6F5|nr:MULTISPECIES: PadR family transcriptional regulator [unclassified Curtobacterium]ROS78372.1 PadR family transcriptional regulator [Curtobacterium sp. PhB130]TCK65310.1 PadR family transcriptional regulator [Curtobacterium sp. PhB136]